MKHVPAQPLLDPRRLQRDARTEAARAGRLDADRRRIQASRDVMAVLDMLEGSSGKVESRAAADRSAEQGIQCGPLLVVLFVLSISPVEIT